MTDVLVRAAEPGDAEAIAAIFACPRVIRETLQLPWRSVEERRERLAQRTADLHRLVAEVDGRVVGSVGLHVEPPPRRRHVGRIGIAVHDAYQGRGIGTALLEAALHLAFKWLNLARLELDVYADNAPAVHLYEKLGFEVEGTARAFAYRDGQFVDAYRMARVRADLTAR